MFEGSDAVATGQGREKSEKSENTFVASNHRCFTSVNSLVIGKNMWLILLSKILLFLNIVKCKSQKF
jgi:hypothetical protein